MTPPNPAPAAALREQIALMGHPNAEVLADGERIDRLIKLSQQAMGLVDALTQREAAVRAEARRQEREEIASMLSEGADEIIALRDASPFHSVSHGALTTYAVNLAGWADNIRDRALAPPTPDDAEKANG